MTKPLTMKIGDKTIYIQFENNIPTQNAVEGCGVQTQSSKSMLGQFIADELKRRQQNKQEIIDALMEKPSDPFVDLDEKQILLAVMTAKHLPVRFAPHDPKDPGLEGDEMNMPLLIVGKDFNRNPALDRYIPSKVRTGDSSTDPKCITFHPSGKGFKFIEPIKVSMIEELSDEQYAKVRQMFEKIFLKEEIDGVIYDAFISFESELYEFIFIATDEADEVFPEDETHVDCIIRNEKRVLAKFKQVYGIDLSTSHIKLVDLIKQI